MTELLKIQKSEKVTFTQSCDNQKNLGCLLYLRGSIRFLWVVPGIDFNAKKSWVQNIMHLRDILLFKVLLSMLVNLLVLVSKLLYS